MKKIRSMNDIMVVSLNVMQQAKKKQNYQGRILSQKDLYDILPFGRTKIQQMLSANILPCTRVGKDYITTYDLIENWIKDNIGSEVYF